MGNCCGPFKRGKRGKATNPNQQCFVDCCGNICPPDDCCDSIEIQFECGCPPPSEQACSCESSGYGFSGIRFKRKKKKIPALPTFSKKTLEANGFVFSQAGTIPETTTTPAGTTTTPAGTTTTPAGTTTTSAGTTTTPAGSSSSTEESSSSTEESSSSTEESSSSTEESSSSSYSEESSSSSVVTSSSSESSSSSCDIYCIRESQFNPLVHIKVGGPYDTKEECETNCSCGSSTSEEPSSSSEEPSSSSESSSSSCPPCQSVKVTLSTSGCCLYLGSNSIESVGKGSVSASLSLPEIPGCDVNLLLNGKIATTIDVEDGDTINVELQATGNCLCCETGKNCNAQTAPMWVQKSNKENKTIILNKSELMNRVKFVTNRVRKRKSN